jgi:parallel beta-helix repeat protein
MNNSPLLALFWLVGIPLCMIILASRIIYSFSLDDVSNRNQPPDCDTVKMAEIRAPANSSSSEVIIDCNLHLRRNDNITKRLVLRGTAASNLTIDCHGGTINGGDGTFNYAHRNDKYMIWVKSERRDDGRWSRPENVTVRSCNVIGSIRISGMSGVKTASRSPDYVERVRRNAPTGIIFDNIVLTAIGKDALYFGTGTTNSMLINSEIKGTDDGVPIYLDAESTNNTIKDNDIHPTTTGREVMAIDGSSHNRIINNRFSGLNHGGIWLYRNCGEDGQIRHSTPSYNQIINNIFYYDKYTGFKPAIFIGARNGKDEQTYCDEDTGSNFGSSISNLDFAQNNIVMQNRIYKRSVTEMIRLRKVTGNINNIVDYNTSVKDAERRPAGCYVADGLKNFIVNGERIDVFINNGRPVCTGVRYTCDDGSLTASTANPCTVTQIAFDCPISGNNGGCKKPISCPAGMKIVGIKAACNLETITINEDQLGNVPLNTLKVVKQSDYYPWGSCAVDSYILSRGN